MNNETAKKENEFKTFAPAAGERDALVQIFARNIFYRRLYFLALGLIVLVIVMILMLGGLLFYLISSGNGPLYFATDKIGELLPSVPLSEPNMSTDEVIKWAIHAVETTYSYDYVNYRQQMQDTEKYFTAYGWYTYLKALTASNAVLALTDRKQVVTGQVVSTPAFKVSILNSGLLSGAYAWQIQMPLLVTYATPPYDGSKQYTNALIVKVIVQRQPILQSMNGLGIVQLIAQEASSVSASNGS